MKGKLLANLSFSIKLQEFSLITFLSSLGMVAIDDEDKIFEIHIAAKAKSVDH